jgi:hypothetical protein
MPTATSIRRWTGGIFIGIALLMLVLGLTFLEPKLKGVSFIFYWLICASFTLSAATVALLDAMMIRRESKEKIRDLLEDVLRDGDDGNHSGPKK